MTQHVETTFDTDCQLFSLATYGDVLAISQGFWGPLTSWSISRWRTPTPWGPPGRGTAGNGDGTHLVRIWQSGHFGGRRTNDENDGPDRRRAAASGPIRREINSGRGAVAPNSNDVGETV